MDDRRGVEVYSWRWGPDGERRPGLPWIGIFLVVFGGLLLIERALPEYETLGNIAVLAAGLASLLAWAISRGTGALYAGAFLTAAALPGTIEGLGYPLEEGWGTFIYGLAFLFVALVRAWRGGGWGWQALFGAVLVAVGASRFTVPDIAAIALPVILVALGGWLLLRGAIGR
ncbi:MAG: hypothetical protein L0221_01040 [Chloroflexi bacterium]|nr:hypothetical protein [Chloroflexota bacterium]